MKKKMKRGERDESYRYLVGKRIIQSSRSNEDLFDGLLEECPHVNERKLTELFVSAGGGIKNISPAILAAAHVMEYNHVHPYKPGAYWFKKFLPRGVSPGKVADNKELMDRFVDVISKTEEEWDERGGAPTKEIKKSVKSLF